MVNRVGDFLGTPIDYNFDFNISVNANNIISGADNINASKAVIKDKVTEYETESDIYVKDYQGDSMIEYNNTYKVLKYNQERLQNTYSDLTCNLVQNAFLNTKVNTNADYSAGGKR